MNRLRLFIRDRSGTAGAEMALMVPLLLIMLFGSFEAANYFYTEQKVIKAVREGARYAGRLPFASYTCPAGIDGTAVAQIRQVTRTGTLSGQPALISGWADSDVTVSLTCTAVADSRVFSGNGGNAPIVQVSAVVAYPSLFAALGLIDSQASVRASAEAVVNGI